MGRLQFKYKQWYLYPLNLCIILRILSIPSLWSTNRIKQLNEQMKIQTQAWIIFANHSIYDIPCHNDSIGLRYTCCPLKLVLKSHQTLFWLLHVCVLNGSFICVMDELDWILKRTPGPVFYLLLYKISANEIRLYTQRLLSWVSYQIHKIVGCACAGNVGNVFPATAG